MDGTRRQTNCVFATFIAKMFLIFGSCLPHLSVCGRYNLRGKWHNNPFPLPSRSFRFIIVDMGAQFVFWFFQECFMLTYVFFVPHKFTAERKE